MDMGGGGGGRWVCIVDCTSHCSWNEDSTTIRNERRCHMLKKFTGRERIAMFTLSRHKIGSDY